MKTVHLHQTEIELINASLKTEKRINPIDTPLYDRVIKKMDKALGLPHFGRTLPLGFIQWYSGMDKEKILKAFDRWQKEKG